MKRTLTAIVFALAASTMGCAEIPPSPPARPRVHSIQDISHERERVLAFFSSFPYRQQGSTAEPGAHILGGTMRAGDDTLRIEYHLRI